MTDTITHNKPTPAFIGASWLALTIGVATYLIGLFNSPMELNEMGYYFTVLVLGLYGAISLQKTVRDRAEGIPTTNLYYGITWLDRKSTRLNSSHVAISYAVFCLKKKKIIHCTKTTNNNKNTSNI